MEIQKIFSEVDTQEKLYSVLMTEDEMVLFSEANKKKKMKSLDKANLWMYKHKGKHLRKLDRDNINFGQDKEATKRELLRAGALTALSPAAGAGIGAALGGKGGAEAGAIIGTGVGSGIALGTAAGYGIKKALLNNKIYRKSWEKQSDLIDVAENKMSEEEFINKWGK